MSNTNDIQEAIDFFESVRHENTMEKTKELFDEIVKSQIAILFKLLIDSGELEIKDNVIQDLDASKVEGEKRA